MIKSSSISFVGTFLTSFFYSIFLSRLLGTDGRGELFELQMYSLVASGIMGPAFGQYLYEKNNSLKGLIKSVYFSVIVIIIMAVSIGYLYFLSPKNKDFIAISLVFLIFFQTFMLMMLELVKFLVKLRIYQIVLFAQSFILFSFLTVIYVLSINISVKDAINIAIVSYAFISILITFVLYFHHNFTFQKNITIVRFIAIVGFRSFGSIVNYSDRLLIISIADVKTLGGVAVCYSLESISSKFFSFFSNIRMNLIVTSSSKKLITMNYLIAVSGLLGIILSYYLGAYFLALFFGEEFSFASTFLIFIIIISALNGISWYFSQSWILTSSLKYIYYRHGLGLMFILIIIAINLLIPAWLTVEIVYSILVFSSIIRLAYTTLVNLIVRDFN